MIHTDESDPVATETMTPPSSGQTPASIKFHFEGRELTGRQGEPIARALFRNGIRTLSHSVKYHRPRGISCGRGRCVSCLVEVDGDPSVKSCMTPLADGMRIRRQNFRPFYSPFLTAAIRLLPFPAGFYFRFFSRPRFVRKPFLATLRKMAGVARIDVTRSATSPTGVSDRSTFPKASGVYDVIVVGAGVSGLAAARAAADADANVLLIEEQPFLGGNSARGASGERSGELISAVASNPRVHVAIGCTAQGYYGDGKLLVAGRARLGNTLREIRGNNIVLATGGSDVIPLFENNDTPGIFGVRSLRLFLERDDFAPGSKAAVIGTGAELDDAVDLIARHGVELVATIDTSDARTSEHATRGGGRIVGVHGREWVSAATFETSEGRLYVECDIVCVAGVPQPAFELAQQAGFTFSMSTTGGEQDWVMLPTTDELNDGDRRVFLVGTAAGILNVDRRIDRAAGTGRRAAGGE